MNTTSTTGETYDEVDGAKYYATSTENVRYRVYVSPKSRLVALLLCWFLGLLGGHRFYVGKIGTAIVMLLCSLSVIGLFASLIWWCIDFVMIAAGAFRDKEGLVIRRWEAIN